MNRIISAIPYITIFFCIVAALLLIKYPFQNFTDTYDPYYHVSHAGTYINHSQITYPQLTYLSIYPADLWLGYHLILSIAHIGIDENEHSVLIARTILIHILLSALLITVIAYLCVTYFKTMQSFYLRQLQLSGIPLLQLKISEATVIMVSIGAMFIFSGSFLYRTLFTERPHILMILFVVIGLIYLLRRQYFPLVILALLAPLSYSLSLFIFIPAIIPLLGWLIVDRDKKNLQLATKPFLYTSLGYVIGLLIHPATWGYLLNGVLLALYAIFQSLLWWVPGQTEIIIPAEMQFGDVTATIALLLPILLLIGLIWYRIQESRKTSTSPIGSLEDTHTTILEAGFCGLALLLGLGSLLVTRAVEYSVPLLFITSITFLFCYAPSFAKYIHQQLLSHPDKVASFYKQTVIIVKNMMIKKITKVVMYTLLVLILTIFLSQSYLLAKSSSTEVDRLKNAIHFLSAQDDRKLILLSEFSMYTQGVFYGPTNRYATGMDPRMTHFYNPDSSNLLNDFLYGEMICGTSCTKHDDETILDFLHEIEATHLLIDFKGIERDKYSHLLNRPFLELQYQDEQYPEVHIYKLNTE